MTIRPVPLDKSYRLLNHGPTVMVSAKDDKIENVMSASWVCALDIFPAKVTAVLGRNSFTRKLIEKSQQFAIQVPIAKQAEQVIGVGTQSYCDNPNKLTDNHIELFYQDDFNVPLVKGCAAWLICRLIPEEYNQQKYDLLIGEVIGAWADDRIYENAHWKFDEINDDMKTLHYVAGNQFYITGKGLVVKEKDI